MFKEFLTLIYPEFCHACFGSLEGGEEIICTGCRFDLPKTNFHLIPSNMLEQKFWGKINLTYAIAYLHFIKHSKVQSLIHNIKYKGHQEIGTLLGKWYGHDLMESGFNEKFDLIIPIPLHKSKLKQRGFNQCDTFAESLSSVLDIPYSTTLVDRVTATSTQTNKSRFKRWINVEEIFIAKKDIKDKRILLVDDVITTGSTVESCGHALIKEGAIEISVACMAMAR